MIRRINSLIVLFLVCGSVWAQNIVPIPPLKTRVTDQTNTLSETEKKNLESKLSSFEQSKGSQVVVLVIPTTGDETIEQYGIRVADQWKIGREGVDDGAILLVAMQDRKMRIEVGYGLEGAIPDALAKRIISQIVTPEFRAGHFYDGINDGVDAIISLINGEELPVATPQQRSVSGRSVPKFSYLFIILGLIIFGSINSVLKSRLGKVPGTLITAGVIFLLVWLIINVTAAIFATIILSLIFNIPHGGGRGGGYRTGGGFYGGGFSSGGGFSGGGFSGGGGGFGGGGASGGW